MSLENRKRMYDQLVEQKRFGEIDQGLLDEFGPVQKEAVAVKPPVPEEKEPKPKKKKGDA